MTRVAAVLLMTVCAASAQISGDLKVQVLDASGAAVPGARISVRSVATGTERSAASGAEGSVRFTQLQIGAYEVKVQAKDFAAYSTSGIVNSGTVTTVVVRLEIEAAQQEVLVTELGSPVNTVDSQLQFSRDSIEMTRLPLPLTPGSVLSLATTFPGVVPNRKTQAFTGFGYFSVNGGRGRANNITLDNATATDVTLTGESGLGTVPVDGIAEFAIITNNFNAEYGRNASSQVQIVTKGGGNAFHGRVFEFFQNDKLNAREYFDTTGKTGVLRNNDWGVAAGGPLRRDRVFWFGSYEQQKTRGAGGVRFANVPRTAQITPEIDPTAAELLRRLEVPITPTGTILTSSPQRTDRLAFSGRIDANLTDYDFLYVRAGTNDVDDQRPSLTFSGSELPTAGASSAYRDTNATISETHVFGPRTVNLFMASFGRADPTFAPLAGFGGPYISFRDGTASFGISPTFPQGRVQNTYQYLDTLTHARGRHQLKFGAEVSRIQANDFFDNLVRGSFGFVSLDDFLRGVPAQYQQRFGSSYRGYRVWNQAFFAQDDIRLLPSLTLNLGLRLEVAGGPTEVNGRVSNLNLSKQESLGGAGTGPLGAFDIGGAAFGRNWNWGPRFGFAWNPLGTRFAVRGGYGIAHDFIFLNPITSMRWQPPFMYGLNLSPAQITGANSFSALVAGSAPIQLQMQAQVGTYGTAANLGSLSAVSQDLRNPQVQQWNLTVERQLEAGFVVRASYVGTKGTYLQRSRPINTIAPGAFTPPQTLQEEQALAQAGEFTRINAGLANGSLRIDRRFTAVNMMESSANSIYHSAQFLVSRRFNAGFGVSAAYTWSKSIDDLSDPIANTVADIAVQQNPFDNRNNRAVSGFDVPHRLVVTHMYEPQFTAFIANPVLRTLVHGWQFNGILQAQSGYPVTLLSGARAGLTDPTLLGGLGATRPNVVGPINLELEQNPGLGTLNPNKAADSGLEQPLVGNFGSLGRNAVRMNGLFQVDWTLGRAFVLTERLRTEFQAQVLNVFNNVAFTRPGIQLASPQTFGYYNETETDPRSITLALRLIW